MIDVIAIDSRSSPKIRLTMLSPLSPSAFSILPAPEHERQCDPGDDHDHVSHAALPRVSLAESDDPGNRARTGSLWYGERGLEGNLSPGGRRSAGCCGEEHRGKGKDPHDGEERDDCGDEVVTV
jgi:hypothetical protein